MSASLSLCPSPSPQICAAGEEGEYRPAVLSRMAVPRLAKLLDTNNSEIKVKSLLSLGMLCSSNREGQTQLANTPGAIKRILNIMKGVGGSSNTSTSTSSSKSNASAEAPDVDSLLIAKGLFGNLAKNEEIREAVEAALRLEDAYSLP